jgi:hypothetical protein
MIQFRHWKENGKGNQVQESIYQVIDEKGKRVRRRTTG